MKSKKTTTFAAVLIVTASVIAAVPAHAQTNSPARPNYLQGLISSIAEKFGLQQSQVQAVADEYHAQKREAREKNMQTRQKQHLDELVKEGKITTAQESAIFNELESLRKKYNPKNLKDLTPEQRKTQIDSMQSELKTWAETQGIDPSLILPKFGMGPRDGMNGGMRFRGK